MKINCAPTLEKKEHEVVIDDKTYFVRYTLVRHFECDSNYGADADGNRGKHACFLEKESIEDLAAYLSTDDDSIPVTDEATLKKIEEALL